MQWRSGKPSGLRAAANALREREQRICVGIAQADREESPFAHREDIRSVAPLEEDRSFGESYETQRVGATVVFRAVPGMTAEWLQRLVDCHLARNEVLRAQGVALASACPLAVPGAKAQVRSVGDGFAVAIRASDPGAIREILRRARQLGTTARPQ